MRGSTIFVAASFILPILAGPIPVQDAVSLGSNVEKPVQIEADPRGLVERVPIIEAIPVEIRSESKANDDVPTEDVDLESEKRTVRPGSGTRPTVRAVRGPGYTGGKRSLDERAIRGQGRGGDKRTVDERAIRGNGRGGDKRSVEERAIRGQGRGGDKRTVDERAIRGNGRGGDKRTVDERAIRGQGRGGDRRSMVKRAIRGQGRGGD